jgi:hypothetical protein
MILIFNGEVRMQSFTVLKITEAAFQVEAPENCSSQELPARSK